MAQKLHLLHPELTLGQFCIQLLFPQHAQHCPQVVFMLSLCLRVDENIIYKNDHKLVQVWPKDAVHIIHEHRRSVCYSKWHHYILVVSITRPKSSFLDVVLLHPDLVIPRTQINLREHRCPMQLIQQIINPWQRVFVLDGQLVQLPVVYT
ncbi:hypothetical protein VIGAN_11017800 [Vigna angularis var. angularis]|uniref:Uncharacterized protein n=1 Tax=Vigna angularis var. angularis TaxID=157739 RepID=A0A0S3T710_PHAAN|nr:hypothetical protein VIGAN_11017800 [Vigna angularis var. angularis]